MHQIYFYAMLIVISEASLEGFYKRQIVPSLNFKSNRRLYKDRDFLVQVATFPRHKTPLFFRLTCDNNITNDEVVRLTKRQVLGDTRGHFRWKEPQVFSWNSLGRPVHIRDIRTCRIMSENGKECIASFIRVLRRRRRLLGTASPLARRVYKWKLWGLSRWYKKKRSAGSLNCVQPSEKSLRNRRQFLDNFKEHWRSFLEEGLGNEEKNQKKEHSEGDQVTVTIPTVTFKYPYDTKLYERTRFNESTSQELIRLNRVLKELENLKLEEEDAAGKNVSKDTRREGESKNKTSENNESKKEQKELPTDNDIKEQIDRLAIPLLSHISQKLGLKSKLEKNDSKEGNFTGKAGNNTQAMCLLDGVWVSTAMGLEINVTTLPNMLLKVVIKSARGNGVINKKWSIRGLTLSKRAGPLILAGMLPHPKKVAAFVGQCKSCQGQGFIFGMWSITASAQRCSDLWTTVETKLDILKRLKKKVVVRSC